MVHRSPPRDQNSVEYDNWYGDFQARKYAKISQLNATEFAYELQPFWSHARLEQIMGRAVRFENHPIIN